MYRNKIRNGLGEIFKGIFTPEDYVIHFGYDCINIELRDKSIYSDLIRKMENYFGVDSTLIYVIHVNGKGQIVLQYDVSKFILDEYGSWEVYDEKYGYYD